MDFYEVLDQVIDCLKQRERVTYRALKAQFQLDDELLETLKEELLFSHPVIDEAGKGLVWTGETREKPTPTPQPDQTSQPKPQPVVEQVQAKSVAPSPAETHTSDTAERRQLTVMFIDLVDSTRLSSQLDPEDLREIVRKYQRSCSEVITKYDGKVVQLLGDGLLVYFGYPQAHEDDAQRAIHSGLGIVRAIHDLNIRLEQNKGVKLAVSLGIHTGLVVVGEMGGEGHQEQLALGATPNIAARIQSLASTNTLVISDATHRLVQGFFDVETLGEHELRGVAQPIAVYHVLGDTGIQNRLDTIVAKGLTPLVGRESECTLLFDRWEQTKDGNGQVVLVSGEAGIGKSRLVQVLKDHVSEDSHTRLEYRSSPYFTNSALYPIIDMLQRTLRFQAEDTSEQKLAKLIENLRHYRLPLEETVPLFGNLLSLTVPEDRYPPLNLAPQRQRQKTLEAIVAIIVELAERQAVLFILEDLHWGDPTTLELLNLLIDQTPTASVYALLTCRPEFQPSWSHRSYLTEMTLNRLSRSQIESITTQVAGGKTLPAEVVEQLVDKTDGVPLYVEEMTKAVLESGVLKEMDERYKLTGTVGSLTIPATLQDSLMARLDRLVTAKAVAQYASVIGRQFSYDLLQAVSQLDESTLQRELSRLVEAELIYQRGLPPQTTYLFKHALISDAAYQSLLRSTRQGYHRRIAEVLTERFPDTTEHQPELLAHHYTEASNIEAAVWYWRKAGEQAIRRSAYTEATYHLTRGLEVLVGLPDRATRIQFELTLQITLGSVLLATKGFAALEVEQTYAYAYQLCQHVGDNTQRTQVLLGLRNFYQLRSDLKTAYELGQEALRLATAQGDTALIVQAYHAVAHTLFFQGVFTSAREHAEQSLALYNSQQHQTWVFRSGTGDLRVQSLATLAWILAPLGYVGQAVTRIHEAIDIARELHHPFSLATALASATWVYRRREEPHQVREPVEELMALATKHGFAFQWARGVFIQGWARAMQGEGIEGIAQMHEGMAAMQETNTSLGKTEWLLALAEAYAQHNQLNEAYRFVTEALVLTDKYDTWAGASELHGLMGKILIKQHGITDGEEAEEHFYKALTTARSQEAKLLELRAATSLSKLWQQQGKVAEAYDLLAPVYGWFTEGFDTLDLIDAKALLDELA